MSSGDMFANSEEVDNPTAMETDDKTDDSEISKNKDEEAEVDDTDAVESGDKEDDDNEESGVLQDRSNIEETRIHWGKRGRQHVW